MNKSIRIATIITYLTIILGVLISLISTPFIVTNLGQAEYGIYSLILSIIGYISILDLGFGSAVIRFNSKYISHKDQVGQKRLNGMFLVIYFLIGLFSMLIGMIMISKLDVLFGNTFHTSELLILRSALTIALLNVAISFPLNVFSSIIMAYEKFVFLRILNLLKNILSPVAMVLMVFLNFGTIGIISSAFVISLMIGMCNIWYCVYKISIKIEFFSFDFLVLKEIIRYSFFIFLSSVAYQIYWNTNQFIIGSIMGASAIAIYAVAAQLNIYFTSICNVIAGFYLPKLTKMIVEGQDQQLLLKEIKNIGRIQAIIVGYVLSAFSLFGSNFIDIWVGEKYQLAFTLALLIMFPQVFSIVQSLFATMLEAMNRHKVKAIIYLSMSIVNVVLSLVLIPNWGLIGGAIATAIGLILNALLNNIYYVFVLKMNLFEYWKLIFKTFLPICIFAIVVSYFIKKTNIESYFDILLYGSFFSVGYFLLILFAILSKKERLHFYSLIRDRCTN